MVRKQKVEENIFNNAMPFTSNWKTLVVYNLYTVLTESMILLVLFYKIMKKSLFLIK